MSMPTHHTSNLRADQAAKPCLEVSFGNSNQITRCNWDRFRQGIFPPNLLSGMPDKDRGSARTVGKPARHRDGCMHVETAAKRILARLFGFAQYIEWLKFDDCDGDVG